VKGREPWTPPAVGDAVSLRGRLAAGVLRRVDGTWAFVDWDAGASAPHIVSIRELDKRHLEATT
jgi:hypothetical protein